MTLNILEKELEVIKDFMNDVKDIGIGEFNYFVLYYEDINEICICHNSEEIRDIEIHANELTHKIYKKFISNFYEKNILNVHFDYKPENIKRFLNNPDESLLDELVEKEILISRDISKHYKTINN